MKVDYKGDILEAILLPKVLRPWIITSTHEFCRHQGGDRCYSKIRATYYWYGMKNDICQAIFNCKICKMESPNYGKYMNLHLEIGTAPMDFLAMHTIEIRDADSAYKYTFTLIDMLTNYVFIIPVKDICGKTLVHGYIYKVYLPFGRTEKFLSYTRSYKRSDTVTKPSNGMKPSRLQPITTTHFLVLLTHTHRFYSTSAEIAAIHYGTNSIRETPSSGKETSQLQFMNYTSFGRLTQLKLGKSDQKRTVQK